MGYLTPAALAAVTLAVYLRSLLPGLGYSGDAAKWSFLSEVGGVPHETGYPLYVGLVQAFGRVMPLGSPAWRTNLLSALFAIGAVCVVYALLRILSVRQLVGASTALILAWSVTFWSQAVVAEVYSLHILLMVAVLACLARWRIGQDSNVWLLAGLALLALSFGNHMTALFAVPGVAWLVWSDRRRALTRSNIAWAVLLGVLGASQYLYLMYMTDVGGYVEVQVNNVGDIWGVVTGNQFKDRMFAFSLSELITDRIPMLWRYMWDDYSVLLVIVGFGVWRGLRSRRSDAARWDVLAAMSLWAICSAAYALDYNIIDIRVYFLPVFVALAVFLGLGLDGVVGFVTERFGDERPVRLGVIGGLAMLPLAVGLLAYEKASLRGHRGAQPWAEQVLAAVGDDAVIVTDNYDDSMYLRYELLTDHPGRKVEVVNEVPTPTIEAYLDGDGGDGVAQAFAGIGHLASKPAAEIGLFTPAQRHVRELTRDGYSVTNVGPDVWRIAH